MKRFLLAAALIAPLMTGLAHAGSYTYDLGILVNGSVPTTGNASVTVTDTGLNQVSVLLDLANLTTGEFIDTLLLNFNGNQTDLNNLAFTRNAASTGPAAADFSITTTVDAFGNNSTPGYGAGNSGLFDIMFSFASSGSGVGIHRFNGGEKLLFDVTTSGASLSAALFNVTSASPYNLGGPYYAASHIQGIPNGGGTTSSAMGANTSGVVPEPSSVVMGLMGAIGLGGLALRRRAAVGA